jgi:serine/threonine protein kinase
MRLQHVHAIVKWLEDFEKVKVLGVGGTGIVYELLHKSNGGRYAMKELEIKSKPQMDNAVAEAEVLKDIMENISHPNIMHIEKVFQVGSKFYLVFPLCTGGELYEHIVRRGHFSELDAAIIIRDLIGGLHALHEHEILHLDIKPENLLFESNDENARIKITDFGISKIFSVNNNNNRDDDRAESTVSKPPTGDVFSVQLLEEKLRSFLKGNDLKMEKLRGTIGYMAPELFLTGHCLKATDVFAAGVVLYILLCGRPPFYAKTDRGVLEKTALGHYTMLGREWDQVSADAKDLVTRMLKVNPEARVTTTEILNHPWIKQLDEENNSLTNSDGADTRSSTSTLATKDGITTSISTTAVPPSGDQPTPLISKSLSQSMGKRRTNNINLTSALKQLTGHVKQLRSEKLATNVTRLVSLMNHHGVQKSNLSHLYLIPLAANLTTDDSLSPNRTMSTNLIPPPSNENAGSEAYDTLFLNSDFRKGFSAAIKEISDNDCGKISVEKFMSMLKLIHLNSTPNNNNTNMGAVAFGPLIISKFIDRDNDGYITADEIFAAQALILQKSEVFLKIVFRIYAESIWYPGRQLNLRAISQLTTPSTAGKSGTSETQTPG